MEDFLSSVDQWKLALLKELNSRIEEMQLGLQMSSETWA
jgi:hypothetical protein